MPTIGQNPNIMIGALNVDLCLIDMNEGAGKDLLERSLFGFGVMARQFAHKRNYRRRAEVLMELIINHLTDDAIRKPKGDTLVGSPGVKIVSEDTSFEPLNAWWRIANPTHRTASFATDIFDRCLPAT